MLIAPTLPAESRLIFHPGSCPRENPLRQPQLKISATGTASVDTKTHLANLDHILGHKVPPPPPPQSPLLNLPNIFPSLRLTQTPDKHNSPRSLARLHRLLSDSPRASPKSSIASNWRLLHGADNWSTLLDPLDENLRRELVRYGEFTQAAYAAFYSNPESSSRPIIALSDRSYRVTRNLFATSSVGIPQWMTSLPPWMTRASSLIGFVGVCDSAREIRRMGRREIVVSLRGTATGLEWAENFRSGLHPIHHYDTNAKVSSGFYSLYKTQGSQFSSLSSAVVQEVRDLVEKYKGDELSITITGHSLGAALAQLAADEISSEIKAAPPISVVSFGGPRVGNRAFAERLEGKGVKVLRIVNANDVVPRVPGLLPHVWEEGYTHVGVELKVDNRVSPYLRPDADPACCHDLEAYLHLVDGFMGTGFPFRADAKRSLARLLSQQRPNMKKIYVSRAVEFEQLRAGGQIAGIHHGCLASPSG